MSEFTNIARELFLFLESSYGFRLESILAEEWGGELRYKNVNKGVGIRLLYECPSAFVFVFIYRLVNGQFVDTQLPINEGTDIRYFDFTDLLEPYLQMKPSYEYPESSGFFDEENGLRNFVTEFANRLEVHGKDLLQGDFTRFPIAEKAIRARARGEQKPVTPVADKLIDQVLRESKRKRSSKPDVAD